MESGGKTQAGTLMDKGKDSRLDVRTSFIAENLVELHHTKRLLAPQNKKEE